MSKAHLRALVEEATVDCYNDEEQATGLYTMLQEHLVTPFQAQVLGVSVTVQDVDLTDDGRIVAICNRGGARQSIPILDLPLPLPPPAGAEWNDAYGLWLKDEL